MKRTIAVAAAIICCSAVAALAVYSVSDKGEWPATWPKELEPLRKQARTLVGPLVPQSHYLIPFTKRHEFEAAWPHFFEVNSKGAPVILVPGPKTDFFEVKPAGVLIHSPPAGKNNNPAAPEAPIECMTNVRERWMTTTYIELAVDGDVVDLNRIPPPADTPIIDERFESRCDK